MCVFFLEHDLLSFSTLGFAGWPQAAKTETTKYCFTFSASGIYICIRMLRLRGCSGAGAKVLKKQQAVSNYTRSLFRSVRIWAPAMAGTGDVKARIQLAVQHWHIMVCVMQPANWGGLHYPARGTKVSKFCSLFMWM